jgi:Methyltransferase domain
MVSIVQICVDMRQSFQLTLSSSSHPTAVICTNANRELYKEWYNVDARQMIVKVHGLPSPEEGNDWSEVPMRASDFFDSFENNNYAMYAKSVDVVGGGETATLGYIKLSPQFWVNRVSSIDEEAEYDQQQMIPTTHFGKGNMFGSGRPPMHGDKRRGPPQHQMLMKPGRPIFHDGTIQPPNMRGQMNGHSFFRSFGPSRQKRKGSDRDELESEVDYTGIIPAAILNSPPTEYKIPRHLIFTYKTNILETKTPKVLYDNVIHTINAYRKAWNVDTVPVWFLTDRECKRVINEISPDMVDRFTLELNGAYKADMCRAAALYLAGGYYLDVDLRVVEPVVPEPDVSFSTVEMSYERQTGGWFFQAFLASAPRSLLMLKTLEVMDEYYYKKKQSRIMGPETMKEAFNSLTDEEIGKYYLLDEMNLAKRKAMYPDLPRQVGVGLCNFIVHDEAKHVVHFFSRIVGVNSCLDPNSPMGQHAFKHQQEELQRSIERNKGIIEDLIDEYNENTELSEVLASLDKQILTVKRQL